MRAERAKDVSFYSCRTLPFTSQPRSRSLRSQPPTLPCLTTARRTAAGATPPSTRCDSRPPHTRTPHTCPSTAHWVSPWVDTHIHSDARRIHYGCASLALYGCVSAGAFGPAPLCSDGARFPRGRCHRTSRSLQPSGSIDATVAPPVLSACLLVLLWCFAHATPEPLTHVDGLWPLGKARSFTDYAPAAAGAA